MVVVTKAVGGGARRRAGTRQDPPAADDGGTGGDASGLSDLILQQAESQAEAIADRIDALDQRTAAVSAEVDATNEQIAALANSEDPAAGDLAAAANALVTAYQAELEGLNADRAAAVAELAAINGTISGLGGTPVDPPADPGAESGASSGSDAGAGTGTTSNRTGQARGGAVVAVSRSQIALRRTPPPPARRARATRQDAPAATGDPSTDVAALAEVIATQATDQATAQADAITALDAEIAALEDQLAASQAALDALRGAEAPDQAAIDAEQANYDSIQTQLDAKRADRDAAAAELDAINETATETGGEPAAVPAEGAAPGGGMGAGAGGTLAARLRTARPDQRVAAGLLIMRRIVQGQIAPNRLNARAVDSGTIQQIIDQVTAVQSALQQVLTDLGSEPARTVQDRAVWSILGRAATEAGARGVSIAMVRQLTLEAHAGRAYRRALIDLTVAARVSALGADRANAETYRTRLEAASLDAIEDDYESYTGKKADLFRPGRQVPSRAAATETATRPRPEAPQAPAGGGAEATFPDGEENLFRLAGAYRRDGGGTR